MPARRWFGARLGDAARMLGVRRHVATRNLLLSFPEMTSAEREDILRRHFRLLGAMFMDECALQGMSADTLRRWMNLDESSLPPQQPVIFCTPHFVGAGNGGVRLSAVLGEQLMFHYKPMHNDFWDDFYSRLRQQYGTVGVSATKPFAMRDCARQLKSGGAIFFLPDTDTKRRKSSVFASFLGVESVATSTAVSRLAAMTGAQVRMFFVSITPDGYDCHLSPPLEDFPGADVKDDARRINDMIAERIRHDPAQYYWLHRRFKTRPEGERDRYA